MAHLEPARTVSQAAMKSKMEPVTQPAGGEVSQRRRGAILTMELVLTLPILLIVLLALFEFAVLLLARGSVVDASRAGARVASMAGATHADVEMVVRRVLSPALQRGVSVAYRAGHSTGDVVIVGVQVPMASASPDLLWPIGFSLRRRDLLPIFVPG